MRRTEQEFKEEVLKRSREYRKVQARKRKNRLGIALCVCLFCAAVTVLNPFSESSEATAVDGLLADEVKSENVMMQQSALNNTNEQIVQEDAAEPMDSAAEYDTAASTSRTYNVISIEVRSSPEQEKYERFFTEKEEIVPIIIALERFYPVDENLQDPEDAEGMSYEITVTYTSGIVRYTLFGDSLCSDRDGWIRVDEAAARKLETALSQESDILSVTVSSGNNEIILDHADAAVIIGYLSSDQWIAGTTRCAFDYTISVHDAIYRYHSDCGTICNEVGQFLSLSEVAREVFNDIVCKDSISHE